MNKLFLLDPLTPRQAEALKYIALGLTSKEIGKKMNVTEKCIELYRGEIISKLGSKNGFHAVYNACKLGIL